MDGLEILRMIVSIVTGIAAIIPVTVELIKYVKKYIQCKDWDRIVQMVTPFMIEAENLFAEGASRKEWVMRMVAQSAETAHLEVDMDKVGGLIDSVCEASKSINQKTAENKMNAGE